jgi:hypothetical protein
MRSASRGCWRRPHRVAKTRGTGWRIAGGIRWRNRVEQGGENPWNPHMIGPLPMSYGPAPVGTPCQTAAGS